MRFLLSLVLIFQGVVNGPTTINGPTVIGIGSSSQITLFGGTGAHCISPAGTTLNCQLTSVPASAKITIQMTDNATTTTVTAVRVCAGTTSCGSSADTINTDVAPVTIGTGRGAAYSDMPASVSGNVMVTVIVASSSAAKIFAQVWTGGCASSCFDKSGIFGGTSANYSVTTSANVTATNEAAISSITSNVTVTAGTTALCASSACTRLDVNGGQAVEYSTTAPTNGTAATLTWANASGVGEALIVTYK